MEIQSFRFENRARAGLHFIQPVSGISISMNDELQVLRDVSARLASAGIEFMVTGSVAMNYYAEPRMTRDIDLVVALEERDADKIVSMFDGDYYVDQQAVSRAIRRRSLFNLIHNESVVKVDCIILKREPYRQEEFGRRRQIKIGDFDTWIVSREDLILSKLYWAKDSRSEMQLRDVRNLLAGGCDKEYLRTRAAALGISPLLKEILEQNE
jgi:hypothetical protein